VAPGGAAADGVAAAGFTGGAVKGVLGGVSTGAASGPAVVGVANGVAVTGAADGVAFPGAAVDGVGTLLGREAGPGVNGGVAVEGMGMAGLAAATGSCEVMTFALPGGSTNEVPSVVGTSASWRSACRLAASRFAASRLRAAVACTLLGLNGGGSVGFLT
jgi:hypothetical protein